MRTVTLIIFPCPVGEYSAERRDEMLESMIRIEPGSYWVFERVNERLRAAHLAAEDRLTSS